ncbi:MAG: PSD1 and planctomycete cytochrome C domain-containing protein [Gemmataceae bacterium]
MTMLRRIPLSIVVRLASLPLIVGAGAAAEPQPTPDDIRFFETKVRPLLVERCFKCHGREKQKGELRLDSAEAVKKAGGSGSPLFTPGKPDDSLLLRAVRHADGVERMPPDGKLKAADIATLETWVKRGAPFPATVNSTGLDATTHWSFQPVGMPAVPSVKDTTWSESDLDRFVLAKLEAAGLTPAPPADRRALIRRATFDLTGLPPTPEEIDAFLRDDMPDAFAQVVDRLLASPAYGERWGRHWLDVARYADSNGLDENIAHGNAWRYRDYVVAAFNTDKAYDRFLLEQIAGDLLPTDTPASRHEHLIATGFLALGPKVLAEPDEKKMELDIVDEQVDTLGRTVVGLTFGCARCHDHKFDPLTTADYYGLAGVFVSTRTMEHFKKVARWHENSLASPAEIARKAESDAATAKVKDRIKELKGKLDDASKSKLTLLQAELAALEKAAPELPSAMGVTEGKPTDIPILRRGNHLTPAAVVARRFPAMLTGATQASLPSDHSGRLELAKWLIDPKHPLTARVIVNRVWRWHFGKGLVRSVDNFGILGEKPTHPELVDWLATTFVRDRWSLKALHRRLMLSSTYRMSSTHDTKAATADPDNRLLWRAIPRRLEAEAIRDSLLAVGGLLDHTAGGPVLTHVKNREFLFDHTSKDTTTYASDRRSIYLPVIRNHLYDVFQLFDATDAAVPNGDRATTTVPTQALFFLNSDLAARASDALAARLLAAPDRTVDERVRRLFVLAYGRPPTATESARVRRGVADFELEFADEANTPKRMQKAWAAVCQMVLASNEFIHIP